MSAFRLRLKFDTSNLFPELSGGHGRRDQRLIGAIAGKRPISAAGKT